MLLERDDAIESLKAQLDESSVAKWKAAALKVFDTENERDRRIGELGKLLRDSKISMP
jgi:hypothetical protein